MDKQSQELIQKEILLSYLSRFPNGWMKFWEGASIGKTSRFFFAFGVQKPNEIANRINQNDISYHHMTVLDNGTDFEIDCLVGGHVWTKPSDPIMAMGKTRIGWRKKSGTEMHVAKHFDKYLGKVLAVVHAEIEKDNLLVGHNTIGTM